MEVKAEEVKVEEAKTEVKELTVVVPSKKIQINSIEHELAKGLKELDDPKADAEAITAIKIEGNSYSLPFCEAFGKVLSKTKNIKVLLSLPQDLNINDIFVGRLKD